VVQLSQNLPYNFLKKIKKLNVYTSTKKYEKVKGIKTEVGFEILAMATKKTTACFLLVSSLTYCSTLKMEAVGSSVKSVDFYQTIQHYITKDKCR
jgi:hypothetical protein